MLGEGNINCARKMFVQNKELTYNVHFSNLQTFDTALLKCIIKMYKVMVMSTN